MEQKEFNLLDEPWIRVITADCQMRTVSLTDALIQAHTFADLSGEVAAQNTAILRLMLAVLHTVFSRVNAEGEASPLEKSSDALKRWKALRDLGRFPEQPIRRYLEAWHERFYLFHPERPFYQAAGGVGRIGISGFQTQWRNFGKQQQAEAVSNSNGRRKRRAELF